MLLNLCGYFLFWVFFIPSLFFFCPFWLIYYVVFGVAFDFQVVLSTGTFDFKLGRPVMPRGQANDIWVGHGGPVGPRGQWTFASEATWRKINQSEKSYRGLTNDNGWQHGHRGSCYFIGYHIPHLFALNTGALLFYWLLLLWRWTLLIFCWLKSKLLYPAFYHLGFF